MHRRRYYAQGPTSFVPCSPTIGSRATPDLKTNDDGSVWIFAAPTPPAGWESYRVETIPGRGWFLYIRLYGPGADWFDEEIFTLPEIEKVSWIDLK